MTDEAAPDTAGLIAAHPVRLGAFLALQHMTASPKQLAARLAKPVQNVAYHVKLLHKVGAIELVDTQPRRGATEHFYRAQLDATEIFGDFQLSPETACCVVTDALLAAHTLTQQRVVRQALLTMVQQVHSVDRPDRVGPPPKDGYPVTPGVARPSTKPSVAPE